MRTHFARRHLPIRMAIALLVAGCGEPGDGNAGGVGDGGESISGETDGGPHDGAPDARGPDTGGRHDGGPDTGAPGDGAPPDRAMSDAGCTEGATRPCGEADCSGGVETCVGGTWSDCRGPAERCNEADDDCDGEIDEDFPDLGAACEAGQGACSASGTLICGAAGDGVQCNAVPGSADAETCNGVDDDCDGAVDEGPDGMPLAQPCYDGPEGTAGTGLCAPGVSTCVDGAFAACEGQTVPAAETCNGLDDDCDGTVDENDGGEVLSEACYDGPEGTVGVGMCRAGRRQCDGGAFGPCRDQVLPRAEICDGRDNDCDGEVDDESEDGDTCVCVAGDERPCYAGPAGTEDVGPCRVGVTRCVEDGSRWTECEGEVLPEAEICDGVDNDCNGAVDDQIEGVGQACEVGEGACRAAGVTFCASDEGRVRCGAIAGEPSEEVCNRIDDDCDGEVDERLGLDEECQVGVGVCVARGRTVCDGEGGVVCGAEPGAPAPGELCNAVDDDCDGEADEDLGLGDACTVGVGACARRGAIRCDGEGRATCSAAAGEPAPEACDGEDNDCDGAVDEGNPGGGQPCDTGEAGVCARGTRQCRDGGFVCVQAAEPSPEVCDGLDNDCDGRTDEDPEGDPLVDSCYDGPAETRGVGPCRAGVRTCDGGRFGACVGQVVPRDEICDDIDNDCDGVVNNVPGDECVCNAGQRRECYTGPDGTRDVGVCRAGVQVCAADGRSWGPCEGQITPEGEVCDGADNDCDGAVDDVIGVGRPCTDGVGACARDGRMACDPDRGALVCDAAPGRPVAESCNGIDDDCDGNVDDVEGLGDRCTAGVGACERPGNRVCDLERGALVCSAEPGAPSDEVCNGADDDCDGEVDDGVQGIGEPCTEGVGQCRRRGLTVCAGAEGIVCGAEPGDPAPEVCDGRDNDCDGTVDDDPGDAGRACSVGVGACERPGQTVCVGGELVCRGQAGAPGIEVCNEVDDDCDGQTDEGLVCDVFRSCLHARQQGQVRDGIYRIQPAGPRGEVFDVWCDQTTDGGGWTLVGSTRDEPPLDHAEAWHRDLLTLAPTAPHRGVWGGLRPLGARFDLRFACRDAVGAADHPMTVDLSFYDVHWYGEITRDADAESCFNERNGEGQQVVPARRDNRTGALRRRWDAWNNGGYLEGEDACNDAGDFTVDLDDRGMDANQSDGTDWGLDDGQRKCGRSGLASGQWFVFARERPRIAVVGLRGVGDVLRRSGLIADDLPYDEELPGRLTPERYDVAFIGRYAGFAGRITPELRAAIQRFGRDGGNIVTEWDGASLFLSGYGDQYRFSATAPEPLRWFRAILQSGHLREPDTPIRHEVPDHPIFANVNDPFSAEGATQYFFWSTIVDDVIPTNLETLATFPGNRTARFPFLRHTAIEQGRRCGANVFLAHFDYQDDAGHPGFGALLPNLARIAAEPPPAHLVDVCPVNMRPVLMLCGRSDRNVRTFVPLNARQLELVQACSPDHRTQALLVTRSGVRSIDPNRLRSYVAEGGIVITEYSISDDIYNMVFREEAVQARAQSGACQDNVMPAVRVNSQDAFWQDNRFVATPVGSTGCGFDLSAFPHITPLGGWGDGTVQIAYRDFGQGRVWLVEADWQDGQDAFTDASRGLMHTMITHGAHAGYGRPLFILRDVEPIPQ